MDPLVDIILATYNGAAHLGEQLASLRAQTYQNWRLIVRDDGSDDETQDILTAFARCDTRVVVLPGGVGGSGPVAAFGAAMAQSDAPYFMFCDQDDVWMPEKTARLLSALRALEGQGADRPCLVHCDLQVVDENLREIAPSFWQRLKLNPEQVTASSLLLRNVVTGCAMMGSAALREAMAPIPEKAMMHDWWAGLIAAHFGVMATVDEPLMMYRRHERNVTGYEGPVGFIRELAGFAVSRGFDLSEERAHLARLQAQARALVPLLEAGGTAAEFGALAGGTFWQRKSFLARHDLIRWRDPLWSAAYHWII